jgi:hypothetical protein
MLGEPRPLTDSHRFQVKAKVPRVPSRAEALDRVGCTPVPHSPRSNERCPRYCCSTTRENGLDVSDPQHGVERHRWSATQMEDTAQDTDDPRCYVMARNAIRVESVKRIGSPGVAERSRCTSKAEDI